MKFDLIVLFGTLLSVYPKVKVRQEQHQHQEDEYDGDVRDLGLKAFLSLSFHSSTSPGKCNPNFQSSTSVFLVLNL